MSTQQRLQRAYADYRGVEEGYRSGLEYHSALGLQVRGYSFEYEPPDKKLRYTVPAESKLYLPDFVLPNGIIVETKGEFTSAERKKARLIKASHPEIDLRFVFSRSKAKIGKKSTTTYAMWCEKNGFLWAESPKELKNWTETFERKIRAEKKRRLAAKEAEMTPEEIQAMRPSAEEIQAFILKNDIWVFPRAWLDE